MTLTVWKSIVLPLCRVSPRSVCLQLPVADFGLDVRKWAPAVSEEGQDFISGLSDYEDSIIAAGNPLILMAILGATLVIALVTDITSLFLLNQL